MIRLSEDHRAVRSARNDLPAVAVELNANTAYVTLAVVLLYPLPLRAGSETLRRHVTDVLERTTAVHVGRMDVSPPPSMQPTQYSPSSGPCSCWLPSCRASARSSLDGARLKLSPTDDPMSTADLQQTVREVVQSSVDESGLKPAPRVSTTDPDITIRATLDHRAPVADVVRSVREGAVERLAASLEAVPRTVAVIIDVSTASRTKNVTQ